MAKDDVERLVQEAEAHIEEDKQKREEIETRNMADSMAYNAEKLIQENKDKISDELQTEINGQIINLRSAIQEEDAPKTKAAMEELQASLQQVGQAVYNQQQAEETGGGEEAAGEEGETLKDSSTEEE